MKVHALKMQTTPNASGITEGEMIQNELYAFENSEHGCVQITRNYPEVPEDETDSLKTDYSLSEDITGKPTRFPEELWKYVADQQRDKVKPRWDKFNDQRLDIIIPMLQKSDICTARPNQYPYILAQFYANIDSFFQVDEDNPTKLKGYEMKIRTTSDEPQAHKYQQQFSMIEKHFLRIKQALLIKHGMVERSESGYRAPLLLVQYVDRVKDFLAKHGDKSMEAMSDPVNAHIVADFYRLTVNLKLLNAVTIPDAHPMPVCADVIAEFSGDSHFTSMDMKDAFWCLPVCAADR